jgi:hypothetical protein
MDAYLTSFFSLTVVRTPHRHAATGDELRLAKVAVLRDCPWRAAGNVRACRRAGGRVRTGRAHGERKSRLAPAALIACRCGAERLAPFEFDHALPSPTLTDNAQP